MGSGGWYIGRIFDANECACEARSRALRTFAMSVIVFALSISFR